MTARAPGATLTKHSIFHMKLAGGILAVIGAIVMLFLTLPEQRASREHAKIYKKRRWCPEAQKYKYLQELHDEDTSRNYFKVIFNEEGLIREESYKNKTQPHGVWFYYNNKQITEKKIYKDGLLEEQIITTYHKQNKSQETHYIFEQNKKKLRVQTRWIYGHKSSHPPLPKRIEYYNTGILDEFVEFEYHKDLVSKRQIFYFDRRLKSYNLYTYNSFKQKTKDEIYNPSHKLEAVIEYSYTPRGRLESLSLFRTHQGDRILEKRNRYTYTQKGTLLGEEEDALIAQRFQKVSEHVFVLDEDECIQCHKTFDAGGELIESTGECT